MIIARVKLIRVGKGKLLLSCQQEWTGQLMTVRRNQWQNHQLDWNQLTLWKPKGLYNFSAQMHF